MHVPARFAMEEAQAVAFAAQRGFGLLTAHDGHRPVGSHLPFSVHGDAAGLRIRVHVARGNGLADLADGRCFLLAVAGADAYVSNDWYVTPDQVSTWLYQAVHLSGPVHSLPQDANHAHGEALLETFEGRLLPKPAWTLEAMAEGKRAAMLGAIITLEMAVTTIEGHRKHNQHKPDIDHIAVVRALERASGSGKHIAAAMRKARPHLDYDAAAAVARPEGLEPPTSRVEVGGSIQLS